MGIFLVLPPQIFMFCFNIWVGQCLSNQNVKLSPLPHHDFLHTWPHIFQVSFSMVMYASLRATFFPLIATRELCTCILGWGRCVKWCFLVCLHRFSFFYCCFTSCSLYFPVVSCLPLIILSFFEGLGISIFSSKATITQGINISLKLVLFLLVLQHSHRC